MSEILCISSDERFTCDKGNAASGPEILKGGFLEGEKSNRLGLCLPVFRRN